jgi:prephenate dehydrogenase
MGQPILKTVTVLGAGLLGASILQAVKKYNVAMRTVAWSRSAESREFCRGKPWCDVVCDTPEEAARATETFRKKGYVTAQSLIVVCVPPDKVGETLAAAAPGIGDDVFITDVASTKRGVCEAARAVLKPWGKAENFVGSHPMAGSEKSGAAAADPDLFRGRFCLICRPDGVKLPVPGSFALKPLSEDGVQCFWERLGMNIHYLNESAHDYAVANVSHAPHLIAAVLSATLAGSRHGEFFAALAGPGLRDTTRVSAGDPALWRSIISENRERISEVLACFAGKLNEIQNLIQSGDFDALEAVLTAAAEWRRSCKAEE